MLKFCTLTIIIVTSITPAMGGRLGLEGLHTKEKVRLKLWSEGVLPRIDLNKLSKIGQYQKIELPDELEIALSKMNL